MKSKVSIDKVEGPGIKDLLGTPSSILDILNAYYNINNWTDPCPLKYDSEVDRNGLIYTWGKHSFIHPPFSQTLKWVSHGIDQYQDEFFKAEKKEQIWLVFTNNSTGWYRRLLKASSALILIDHRLLFKDPRTDYASYVSMCSMANTIFYLGPSPNTFISYFQSLGQGLIKKKGRNLIL